MTPPPDPKPPSAEERAKAIVSDIWDRPAIETREEFAEAIRECILAAQQEAWKDAARALREALSAIQAHEESLSGRCAKDFPHDHAMLRALTQVLLKLQAAHDGLLIADAGRDEEGK